MPCGLEVRIWSCRKTSNTPRATAHTHCPDFKLRLSLVASPKKKPTARNGRKRGPAKNASAIRSPAKYATIAPRNIAMRVEPIIATKTWNMKIPKRTSHGGFGDAFAIGGHSTTIYGDGGT